MLLQFCLFFLFEVLIVFFLYVYRFFEVENEEQWKQRVQKPENYENPSKVEIQRREGKRLKTRPRNAGQEGQAEAMTFSSLLLSLKLS